MKDEHELDLSGELWWCNHHNRMATHIWRNRHVCAPNLGGILLPCWAVNLTDLVELEIDE